MSFGKKNVDFCGITSPAFAKAATCSVVTGCSRNAAAASPRSTAAIFGSYRLHVDALKFLVHNSYKIARVSRRISDSGDAAQVMSAWISDVCATLEANGEESLLS